MNDLNWQKDSENDEVYFADYEILRLYISKINDKNWRIAVSGLIYEKDDSAESVEEAKKLSMLVLKSAIENLERSLLEIKNL